MAKALDDAALALVPRRAPPNKFNSAGAVHRTRPDGGGGGLRAHVHHVVRTQGVPPRALDGARSPTWWRSTTPARTAGGTYNEGIDLVDARDSPVGRASSTSRRWARDRRAPVTLSNDELASQPRRSWSPAGRPIQTLLDVSAGGGLATPDAREAQVRRLLATPTGQAIAWCASCASGSGIDRIAETAKDTTVYTRFTPSGADVDGHRDQEVHQRGRA